MNESRTLLLVIGDFIVAAGIIPSTAFLLDYGILRWARRRKNHPTFEPWWTSGMGVLIFLLALGLFAVQAIVIATLFLGQDYWGRDIFRIIGYLVSTSSAYALLVVYAFEGRSESTVLGRPKRF